MVFFWILAGLTWLGGVVSMLTDLLNLSVSYQFDFNIFSNNLSFPIIFQRIVRTKPKLIPGGVNSWKRPFNSLNWPLNYLTLLVLFLSIHPIDQEKRKRRIEVIQKLNHPIKKLKIRINQSEIRIWQVRTESRHLCLKIVITIIRKGKEHSTFKPNSVQVKNHFHWRSKVNLWHPSG